MSTERVVLAEYFTIEDRTLLFIVRKDFKQPVVIEIERRIEEIQEFVKNHFQAGKNEDGRYESTSDKVNKLNEDEYQSFFAPFVEPLIFDSPLGDLMTEEGDIIWLVPHNFLHYLPLHALKVAGRYLIERNPVCYTPSASVMKYCHQKRKGKREKALILADSRTTHSDRQLLHAQVQAQSIKQLFDEPPAELYIGNEVTKNLLKYKLQESKGDIDILHIACHGFFNLQEALKSGIEFAEEENLTAEEIFGLEIKTDLVTLSACESGINDNQPGDELIGLTRSLIYAGTPSVLVSLWSVDEISTSILMSQFYQKLKTEGLNKVEALQQAQLKVQRMTVQEVIDYCEAAKKQINDAEARQLLEMNIADLQFNAKDCKTAEKTYQKILEQLKPNSKDYNRIKGYIRECKWAKNYTINYTKTAYNNLFHWAPFILVGDWR